MLALTMRSHPNDADDVGSRVRLYFGVLLVIDVAAYVSDLVALLLGAGEPTPPLPLLHQALRYLVTGLLMGGWAYARFTKPRPVVLGVLELAITLALATNYAFLSNVFLGGAAPEAAAAAGLLGSVLLLTLRASLVPSTTLRTAVVGAAAMACWLGFGREPLAILPPIAREGFVFMAGAFVVATSVTSRVIYGLRREVQHALRLGQYELVRKLGEGGMGVVYEGTHVMLRRPTAVKLLPTDKAGEQAVLRFEREVVQTSRLEHPNSVFIYDYGRTPEGQFYYAMEYLDGVTLQELVETDGALPFSRAVNILRQAAAALAEAHDLGLVHRDIKPANIMLCERAGEPDVVKVLDFGLVKTLDNPDLADGVTQADNIVGTPQYLAPEAIRSAEEVGPPSDIYALGAVAFFLLTERDVFVAKTVVEICSLHLSATPESPSDVRGEPLPEELEALVLRCLAKDPAERPADGRELLTALDALGVAPWSRAEAQRWWASHTTSPRTPPKATPAQLTIDVGRR